MFSNGSRATSRIVLPSILCSLALLAPAQAQTWTGQGGTSDWDYKLPFINLYNNWNPMLLPLANADVVFGTAFSSGDPNLNGNRVVNSLTINSPTPFTLNSPGQVLTITSGNITRLPASVGTQIIACNVNNAANGLWNISAAAGQESTGLTVSGAVTGVGNLTKTGNATLTLTNGTNDYTGTTTVQAGTLVVGAASGSTTSNGSVFIQGGATLAGKGRLAGTCTVSTDGHIVPGSDGVAGTLNFSGGLSLTANARLDLDIGSGGTDFIWTNGGTFQAQTPIVINLQSTGGVAPGQNYSLVSWVGANAPGISVSNFALGSTPVPGQLFIASNALGFATIPAAPTNLTATSNTGGQVNLNWTHPGGPTFSGYNVYRSVISGFTPGPQTLVASHLLTTHYVDTAPDGRTCYYLVTASDGAGHESTPSNEASVLVVGLPGIIYVKANSPAGNDGTSWNRAYATLQQALAIAGTGDAIWVAAGTYVPGAARSDSFQLKSGVALYGGFPGQGGQEGNFSVRNHVANLTKLSGDLGGGQRSYHVVLGGGTDNSAILDGFIIHDGAANGNDPSQRYGGGVLNNAGSPTFVNCVIRNNTAWDGGGMSNQGGSAPRLVNCIFLNNAATLASQEGGGMDNVQSAPTLYNCTFYGNTGAHGGAIGNNVGSPILINCILWGNANPQIYVVNASSPNVTYSCIQGGYAGTRNIATDPLFIDAANGDLHLQPNSECTGWGNTAAIPADFSDMDGDGNTTEPSPWDFDRNARVIAGGVDLGAYEVLNPTLVAMPDTPTGLAATAVSSTRIDLTWNPNAQPAPVSYSIYRGLSTGFALSPATLLATGVTGAGYQDNNVVDGRTYFYRLIASNVRGDSFPSNEANATTPGQPGTIFVNAAAPAGGDGRSWAAAYTQLYDALAVAGLGDQIWVAKGTYLPTNQTSWGTASLDSFLLKDQVAVYGGFVGAETSLAQRPADPDPNTIDPAVDSILSGNILDPNNPYDNNRHVIKAENVGPTCLLDGFSVISGDAGGAVQTQDNVGGGIRIYGAPTIRNCVFAYNLALVGGGMTIGGDALVEHCLFFNNQSLGGGDSGAALWVGSGAPIIRNCIFRNNTAGYGAAVLNQAGASPQFIDCQFLNNVATKAIGAIYDYQCHTTIQNCLFEGNTATGSPGDVGAIYAFRGTMNISGTIFRGNRATGDRAGAIFNDGSTVNLLNCLIVGNRIVAGSGGALYSKVTSGGGISNLTNCTLAFNEAGASGGAAYHETGAATHAANCILWGNFLSAGTPDGFAGDLSGTTAIYSLIQGGYAGAGNLSGNPAFVTDPSPGPDGHFDGTDDAYGDLRLAAGSPAIDAGNNSLVPGGTTTDLLGRPRFVNDPATADTGAGVAPLVDLGAIEYLPPIPGDFDRDDDVDANDRAAFMACFSGPTVAYAGNCAPADFNQDGDVDQADYGIFQRCYTGAGMSGNPNCAN